jgi:hypothetical protein
MFKFSKEADIAMKEITDFLESRSKSISDISDVAVCHVTGGVFKKDKMVCIKTVTTKPRCIWGSMYNGSISESFRYYSQDVAPNYTLIKVDIIGKETYFRDVEVDRKGNPIKK